MIARKWIMALATTAMMVCAEQNRAAAPETLALNSGPGTVQLLELFTSEGCSSCPPAEMALSKLRDDPRLWREIVPVAFHVDYWDRLGWKDSFASSAGTARQQTYAARWHSDAVYTPAFVLNGREWRNATDIPPSSKPAGVLQATVQDGKNVRIVFQNTADDQFEVFVARVGCDLKVNVSAGENRGRNLRHDFVVLGLAHGKLERGEIEIVLPEAKVTAPQEAIAVWVTNVRTGIPLQACGGWLQPKS
jgi:hypothetical protein